MTRKADNRETRLPVPAGELPDFTPVPRKCERHDGWTPDRQQRFIEALADTGSVESACRAVNMSSVGAYYLRRQAGAESFRKAWQAALDLGVQRIEDTAMDRALNGMEVPVYSHGKLMGKRTIYNDRLLMFMLRNRAPERFTDGRAKALNAVGTMEIARLKKQWRKEWEQERAGNRKAVQERIERKLDLVHSRWLTNLSPRARAAYDTYKAIEREDDAAGYNPYDDPDHPLGADLPDHPETEDPAQDPAEDQRALPPPDWRQREDKPEDETPRIHKLKDKRWD